MRGIVEEGEPGVSRVAEIDDIQSGWILVEVVAITPRVEAEQRAEQQADGCFMRDNRNAATAVRPNDVKERW